MLGRDTQSGPSLFLVKLTFKLEKEIVSLWNSKWISRKQFPLRNTTPSRLENRRNIKHIEAGFDSTVEKLEREGIRDVMFWEMELRDAITVKMFKKDYQAGYYLLPITDLI